MHPIRASWFPEEIPQVRLLGDSNKGSGGIDSLDAVAVMGRDPDRTPVALWREKTGRSIAPRSIQHASDPRCEVPSRQERVAAAYQQRTGSKVRKVDRSLRHPTFPFMQALLEWAVLEDPHVQAVLCRCADTPNAERWVDGAPRAVQIEAQHLMAVADLQAVDMGVSLRDRDLQVFRLLRDDALIARLVVEEALFWERVLTDTPPIDPPRIAW